MRIVIALLAALLVACGIPAPDERGWIRASGCGTDAGISGCPAGQVAVCLADRGFCCGGSSNLAACPGPTLPAAACEGAWQTSGGAASCALDPAMLPLGRACATADECNALGATAICSGGACTKTCRPGADECASTGVCLAVSSTADGATSGLCARRCVPAADDRPSRCLVGATRADTLVLCTELDVTMPSRGACQPWRAR